MSNNKHHHCPHCGKRKMHAHHGQKNKTESSSSSSSSSTSSLGREERWVPEFLGTGSGTTIWRSSRQDKDESSIEIIDNTTFSRRCWRRGRSNI